MKTVSKGNQRKIVALLTLTFLFFAFVMYCSPMASDDYEFLSLDFAGASELIDYVLHYGNGRVLGNLGAIYLMHHPVLAVAVKALAITGIIFTVPALLGISNPSGYLLSFLLFATIPAKLFGEVYTWTSGFQNYLPPVWLTLMNLYLLRRYDTLTSRWAKLLLCLAILLLGTAGQLYVEHCSLINVVLAAVLVAGRRKTKRDIRPAAVWLAAAVIGLAIMFLVPRVFFVEGNLVGAYRSMNLGGIIQLLASFLRAFASLGAAFPPVGVIVMAGFAVVTTHLTSLCRSKTWNRVLYGASLAVIAYAALNEFLLQNTWYGPLITIRNGMTALVYLMSFVLWAIALYPLSDKLLRNRIYGLLGLGILALVPLLIVSPTPGRLIFFTYVLAVMAILLFARYLTGMVPGGILVWMKRFMAYSAVAAVIVLSATFINIKWMDTVRHTYIQERMEAGDQEIAIFHIPYEYEYWRSPWGFSRVFYYEQQDDIVFTPVDFSYWYNHHWKNGHE